MASRRTQCEAATRECVRHAGRARRNNALRSSRARSRRFALKQPGRAVHGDTHRHGELRHAVRCRNAPRAPCRADSASFRCRAAQLRRARLLRQGVRGRPGARRARQSTLTAPAHNLMRAPRCVAFAQLEEGEIDTLRGRSYRTCVRACVRPRGCRFACGCAEKSDTALRSDIRNGEIRARDEA